MAEKPGPPPPVAGDAALPLALTAGELGCFRYDTDRDEVVCDERARRHLALAGRGPLTFTELTARLDAADADSLAAATARVEGTRLEVGVVDGDAGRRRIRVHLAAAPGGTDGGTVVVGVTRDVTAERRAEEELRASREEYRALVDNLNEVVYRVDLDGKLVFSSPSVDRVLGYSPVEVQGRRLGEFVHPDDRARVMAFFAGLPDAASGPNEYRVRAKDGSYRWVQTSSRPVAVDGRVVGVTGVLADVSDRRRAEAERLELERRLLHAQKLESLGVLAGGIAHDFNNLLMAILGNLDLASMTVPAGSPAHANLEQAIQASRHAADLTRQLLAYSGKGQFEVTTVDLDELVRENASLLHPSIAGPATLVVRSSPEPALVTADPGQIQQVIMNLITNAAEALADGRGEVTLATGVMDCDEAFLRTSRLDEKPAPGRFAALEVRDNGCGMDEATQAHLFDPFFTTKFTGRGLGMAAVLGIVRGHRGAIMVDSAVDAGTAIRVLLPLSADPPAASRPADATLTAGESVLAGRGMVLVVDDDAAVRRLAEYYVRLFGFEAVGAAGGAEALEVLDRRGDDLDLVILDLVMPGMDGVTVFTEIARLRPGLKVLLASGYGEEEAMGRFPDVAPFGFIQKPYRLADLKRKLSVRPG